MSEPKKEPKKQDDASVIVDETVAGLKSKVIEQENLIEKLSADLDSATVELRQLKEVALDQKKGELIADIYPRYDMSKEHLMLLGIDELRNIKKVLDKANVTNFKAGTPLSHEKKTSARQMLDSKFAQAQRKRMEAS